MKYRKKHWEDQLEGQVLHFYMKQQSLYALIEIGFKTTFQMKKSSKLWWVHVLAFVKPEMVC